jgi:hypothetical protein
MHRLGGGRGGGKWKLLRSAATKVVAVNRRLKERLRGPRTRVEEEEEEEEKGIQSEKRRMRRRGRCAQPQRKSWQLIGDGKTKRPTNKSLD